MSKDTVYRQDAIDAVDSETVSTNPEHFKSSEKFIKFMDDVDIASFGKWQWANGFNTALVATRVQLKKLPSAEKAQLSEEDATKDATSGLIKKQDAIDAILGLTNCDTAEKLRAYVKDHDLGSWWSGGVLSSIGKVERLPSAEPKTPSNGSITSINPENTHDRTMGDCISRKDAIKSMAKAIWHYPNELYTGLNSYEMSEALAKDGLMFLPSAEPEAMSGKWIPCSERPPKKPGNYICTCSDGTPYPRVTVIKFHPRTKACELTGTRAYWKVLAWMPLPEPYQPKESES